MSTLLSMNSGTGLSVAVPQINVPPAPTIGWNAPNLGTVNAPAAAASVNIPTTQQGLVNYQNSIPGTIAASRDALNTLIPGYNAALQQGVGVLSNYLGGTLSPQDQLFLNTQAQSYNLKGGKSAGVGNTAATLLNFNQIQGRQQFAVQALPGLQNAMTNWNSQYNLTPGQFLSANAQNAGLQLQQQQQQNTFGIQAAGVGLQQQQNQLTASSQNLQSALAQAQLNMQQSENQLSFDWAGQVMGYNQAIASKYTAQGLSQIPGSSALGGHNGGHNGGYKGMNSPIFNPNQGAGAINMQQDANGTWTQADTDFMLNDILNQDTLNYDWTGQTTYMPAT